MSPRPSHRVGAILAALLAASIAFAGCHSPEHPGLASDAADTDDRGAGDAARTGGDAEDAAAGPNPLPGLAITAWVSGARTLVNLTLLPGPDGTPADPSAITAHEIVWGDGTEPLRRSGRPAASYTHEYRPPPHYRAPDFEHTITATLFDAVGHTTSATTSAVVEAPDNRPPRTRLATSSAVGEAPLRVTFELGGSDPDGTVTGWRIDFGDGTPPVAGPETPAETMVHEYRTIGIHTATLTLTDDQGRNGTARTDIHILPPQDTRFIALDPTAHTATVLDGNGTPLARHDLRRPACGPSTTCETPTDAVVTPTLGYVALSRPDAPGSLVAIDSHDGRARYHIPTGLHPDRLWTAPDGGIWVTHRSHGDLIHVQPGSRDTTTYETPLDGDSPKRASFSLDGQHAFFSGGDPPRVVHLDLTTGTLDTTAFPLGLAPTHLAYHDTVGLLAAALPNGRIAYLEALAGLTTPRTIIDLGLPPDATIAGLTCTTTNGCWVATTPGTNADGALVRLPLRPDATHAATPDLLTRQLDPGIRPTALTHTSQSLVMTITTETERGHLFIDPTSGVTTARGTNTQAGPATPVTHDAVPATSTLQVHPRHPHLVYSHEASTHTWHILDTKVQREVHHGQLPSGTDRVAIGNAS